MRKSPRPKALWYQIANGSKDPKKDSKRARVKSVSGRRAKQLAEYRKVREKYLAENPVCKACVSAKATDIHHKRGKIGSLLCDTNHFISLCRKCHQFVTDHPTEARVLGLVCEVGKWNSPA